MGIKLRIATRLSGTSTTCFGRYFGYFRGLIAKTDIGIGPRPGGGLYGISGKDSNPTWQGPEVLPREDIMSSVRILGRSIASFGTD